MWDNIGVMRTAAGIQNGLERIGQIEAELVTLGVADANLAFNLTWHDWLNLRSLVDISKVIGQAALARENSRGAHYREDFPEVGDLDGSSFTVARRQDDDVQVRHESVAFTIVKPGETLLKDGEARSLLVEAAE
jgi:fumarate reductase flavoprotein subunit